MWKVECTYGRVDISWEVSVVYKLWGGHLVDTPADGFPLHRSPWAAVEITAPSWCWHHPQCTMLMWTAQRPYVHQKIASLHVYREWHHVARWPSLLEPRPFALCLPYVLPSEESHKFGPNEDVKAVTVQLLLQQQQPRELFQRWSISLCANGVPASVLNGTFFNGHSPSFRTSLKGHG
jgi:hypothetical protein